MSAFSFQMMNIIQSHKRKPRWRAVVA